MTVPNSTRRGPLGFGVSGWVPLAVGAALLAGCASTVTGHPVASGPSAGPQYVTAQLSALLPDPTQFPAGYEAVVLPPEAAAQAAGDLTGVGRGSTVQPDGCVPPAQQFGPNQTAVAVGTDNDTRATMTVELTRTGQPLSALRDQLKRCQQVHVSRAGATTTVTTELQAPPTVDADDTLALRRTVAPQVSAAGLTQSMQTLTGQVADVRITVTYMTFGNAKPDTAALDELFTTAVRQVKQG
ncbi:sensor domain-containing protein [Nocardia vinacea]|uniref:sensor domain-containing protein n=1 Tax=Nocardia vinacea TaxID=96468 RepID=UPI001FE0456F|nr:sensor domain-containing protein [Nocardia vinacea]